MFENEFQRRMKNLCSRSGLKIADLDERQAKMIFNISGRRQPLFIINYDGVWEFSCPTILSAPEISEFPAVIMAFVLEQNAKNKRGFWCIETIGSKKVLSYMHNIPGDILTPQEFEKICWQIVKEVDKLEQAFKDLAERL